MKKIILLLLLSFAVLRADRFDISKAYDSGGSIMSEKAASYFYASSDSSANEQIAYKENNSWHSRVAKLNWDDFITAAETGCLWQDVRANCPDGPTNPVPDQTGVSLVLAAGALLLATKALLDRCHFRY